MVERKRRFQKVRGENINDRIACVEFRSNDDWRTVEKWSIRHDGTERAGANWSLRQALQLVESGNWEEVGLHAPETSSGDVW